MANIQGVVYSDQDGDGVIDAGEPTLAGIEVYVDANSNDRRDAGEIFVLSTSAGYSLEVPAGTHRIAQAASAGTLRTYPGSGRR